MKLQNDTDFVKRHKLLRNDKIYKQYEFGKKEYFLNDRRT